VLGYDVAAGGGTLVVNEEEARQVRAIFGFFLEHRDTLPVLDQIARRQWTTKSWMTKAGRLYVGRPFAKQDLLRLLRNVIYTGRVHCQGQSYAGEHAAIVEERVWQRAQDLLQEQHSCIKQVQHRAHCPIRENAQRAETAPERAPRITRLLALALKFEGLIHQGVVKDYADLARLGQVSRARVTQIMNLLNLAPEIQAEVLSWGLGGLAPRNIPETSVRTLSAEIIWSRQRKQWKNWAVAP
jgi:hypothetical protein